MTSVQADSMDALEEVLALVAGSSRTANRSLPANRSRPAGPSRSHGSCLAPDVTTWLASPEQGLTAAIEAVSGAPAGAHALARLAPSSLNVVATVRSDRACWAEITRLSDAEPETCIVGLTYAPGSQVSRLVWVRGPLVPPGEPGTADTAPDGRPVLERYFAALMTSRFGEAAAQFTADTVYSHPPYSGGREWVLFRGRDALRHGFVTLRGPSPARQIVTDLWQRGSRVFIEGVIEGIPDGGTFFSTAEITQGGGIARYVAFYSAERIPCAL